MSSSPCDAYAARLVEMLFENIAEDRFTPAAKKHLYRLANYTICFTLECSMSNRLDWWEKEGEEYWRERAADLVALYLPKNPSPAEIDCRTLQAAVNRYAQDVDETFVRLSRARLRRSLLRGSAAVAGQTDILEMLGGCPFLAHR